MSIYFKFPGNIRFKHTAPGIRPANDYLYSCYLRQRLKDWLVISNVIGYIYYD
jgi:hypothetical protein